MKRACNWAIGSSLAVYYAVACAGYSVFGDTDANVLGRKMPDDILTGFDGPRWIILPSNVAVLVHMLPAYQVWSQPFFEFFEHWRDRKAELAGRDPLGPVADAFQVSLRTSYVSRGHARDLRDPVAVDHPGPGGGAGVLAGDGFVPD